MQYSAFPNRVQKLSDGTLEKPFFSNTWTGLDEMIKRQQAKGWRMKGGIFEKDGNWCCIMHYARGPGNA